MRCSKQMPASANKTWGARTCVVVRSNKDSCYMTPGRGSAAYVLEDRHCWHWQILGKILHNCFCCR